MHQLNHTLDTESTILKFCQGDAQAIIQQYKKWLPELFLIAYKYVKNKEDAEDIVADVFTKLLDMPLEKRRQKFIEDGIELKALLIVSVKNKAIDNYKIKSNRRNLLQVVRNSFTTTTTNNVWDTISKEVINTALQFLNDRERLIMELSIEGYSRDEISDKMKVSVKTVSNSLSASRNKLRETLDLLS